MHVMLGNYYLLDNKCFQLIFWWTNVYMKNMKYVLFNLLIYIFVYVSE